MERIEASRMRPAPAIMTAWKVSRISDDKLMSLRARNALSARVSLETPPITASSVMTLMSRVTKTKRSREFQRFNTYALGVKARPSAMVLTKNSARNKEERLNSMIENQEARIRPYLA